MIELHTQIMCTSSEASSRATNFKNQLVLEEVQAHDVLKVVNSISIDIKFFVVHPFVLSSWSSKPNCQLTLRNMSMKNVEDVR